MSQRVGWLQSEFIIWICSQILFLKMFALNLILKIKETRYKLQLELNPRSLQSLCIFIT